MKRLLVNVLKYGISAGIIVYLVVKAQQDRSFAQLRDTPKHWDLLALACFLSLAAVVLTIIRWYWLVRALGMPFTLREAFRLGFLGYLLNFISVGSVGGDLFKAVFLARQQHGRRAQAVASVILDRLIGLYCLFLVAAAGILWTNLQDRSQDHQIQVICRVTLAITSAGSIMMLGLLVPAVTSQPVIDFSRRIPVVGHAASRLMVAIGLYRHQLPTLLLSCLVSLVSWTFNTLTMYYIARGLGAHPSLLNHFAIIPLGSATGALPLPFSGLGAFEYVMDFLYRKVEGIPLGFLFALGYRVITIVIAMLGMGFYLTSRGEVAEVLHEAETDEDEPS